MDRRITPFSGRVAAETLRGSVDAEAYVTPEPRQIAGNPFLLATPGGERDRQLLAGDSFGLIEARGDWAYGQSAKDGYCGWLPAAALTDPVTATHRITVRTTWIYPTPGVRPSALADLHLNARVLHLGTEGRWDRVSCGGVEGFVPSAHLAPLEQPETDPVAVLKLFEGTPYVWAGNTGFGIDCSGLVQAALIACGQPCPGDSDLQEKALGRPLGPDEPLKARDLIGA
jgi:hypothetical protein